jgi:signal transduction histidine kinase
MQAALPLPNESRRLERLRSLGVLDTLPQAAYDQITFLASVICDTPIALISLVDQDRQWFKSRVGLDAAQTPRELAFCAHAIHTPDQVMVVHDALSDVRFEDNPLVTGQPDIRFYAGAPIVTDDGFALGTVCVIDQHSRTLNDSQRAALQSLAKLVLSLMEYDAQRRAMEAQREHAAAREAEVQSALTAAGLDLKSYVDTDYTYRYVNQCYLDYWAKSESDIVGRRIPELMGEATFIDLVKPHFDRALSGEEVHYEAEIDFPGKGRRAVQVSYLPAKNAQGAVSGVVVRVHDIQALRLREYRLQDTVEKLEHKTLELQRFIHIVSHDLREPINTIHNFASLLAEDAPGAPPAPKTYLRFVLDGSQRLKVLLDDLVELLVLDRHSVSFASVDLNQLASNVQDDLRSALDASGAILEVQPLHGVQGDSTLLRILLQNLVANGIKFCPKDRQPVVKIATEVSADGTTCLTVTDNGIGIPSDQTEKIFETFTRLNNKRDFAGSGLGLAICRRIAELHQGTVKVKSSQPGVGSCFELQLPVHLSQPRHEI